MEPLPQFPLFRDPVGEESFERSDVVCACCERGRGWVHTCGMFGPGDLDRPICPWCIADGSAAAKFEGSFNDGTIYPAFKETPQLSKADRELVENRTPGFVTNQGVKWQMCCGRACVYIGEATAADLTGRWKSAVPSILRDCEGWSEEQKAELIASIGIDPAAYVFECQVCGGLKGFWDCG